MSVTDEIKARLDIVSFVQDYVQLKKTGRSYKGLCPFHSENTSSFVVFPDSQSWHCFGGCAEGGDIFSFVMKNEGIDFSEALVVLAERAGVELAPPSPRQTAAEESKERLRGALASAANFFQDALFNAPQAEHVRAYVESRGLTEETIKQFGLGYALDSWDETRQVLLDEGHQLEVLVEAGLLVQRDDGSTYDRFRDRLMIPIRDVSGKIIGFGARALKPEAVPKYLNSPQSALFDKSSILFGLSEARRTIREEDTAIIVEGYMDVMQAHQAGFSNVVAQMGTALTEAQLKTLRRYASRFILALDSDLAGTKATMRGLDTAREALDQQVQPTFNARGMVTYEGHLDAEVRVLLVPEGMDPDDVIRQSPDQWGGLVAGAMPVAEYAIHVATQGRDLDDPKIKKQVVREVSPLIDDIADPTERDHFRQRLARLLKVDERALMIASAATALPARVQSRRRKAKAEPAFEEETAQAASEAWIDAQAAALPREVRTLAAIIHIPGLLYKADRLIKKVARWPEQGDWEGLMARDFAHPEHQAILDAWRRALTQADEEPLDNLRSSLGEVLRPRLGELLDEHAAEFRDEGEKERVGDEALCFVLEMRQRRLASDMQNLKYLAQEAHENGDLTASPYQETIMGYIAARQSLQEVLADFSGLAEHKLTEQKA
jgi:DNA primase